jgi:RibD C-terminal domain
MQTTINGYVSQPNGEMDWMTWNPADEFLQFMNSHYDSSDTLLLGRKLVANGFIKHWENTAKNNPDAPFAKKIVDMPKIVFTKTLTNQLGTTPLWQKEI